MVEKSFIKKYGIKLWVTNVKQPNKHPRAKFNFTLLRSNLSSSSESIVSSTVKYTDIFFFTGSTAYIHTALQNKPPSNPLTFEQERPKKPGGETVSTLHCPKNDITTYFKFLQKKVYRRDKIAPAHFFIIFGVVICKNQVARPLNSFNKCRKPLVSSLESFFCRNLKNVRMSFLGRCNVEVVLLLGFQGLSCSKV